MNSVYIDSSVSASPIYIGPNNASIVILGNTNCPIIANGILNASNISTSILDTSIGATISIGNINADIITIGKPGTIINIGGSTYNPTTITSINSGNISVDNISSNNLSSVNILTNNIQNIDGQSLNIGSESNCNIYINKYDSGNNNTIYGDTNIYGVLNVTNGIISDSIMTINNNNDVSIELGTLGGMNPVTINTDLILNGKIQMGSAGIDTYTSGDIINIGQSNAGTINIGNTTTSTLTQIGGTININSKFGGVNIGTSIPSPGINTNNIKIGRDQLSLGGTSTTSLRGLLDLTNGIGNIGQVLISGGSAGSVSWGAPGPTYITGTINTPSASTRTLQSFGYTFASTLPPNVYLTCDGGNNATTILVAGLAGFEGVSNNWTGFYYLTSTAGGVGTKIYWLATN